MTREEAIKIINCYDIGFHDLSGEKIPADKLVDAFDMAIEALSAEAEEYEDYEHATLVDIKAPLRASAEAVHRWIPCSERLPSESGWYLITVQGCEKVADMGWYYGERDVWEGVSSEQQVIAWMPLPTPYTKGDNDEER